MSVMSVGKVRKLRNLRKLQKSFMLVSCLKVGLLALHSPPFHFSVKYHIPLPSKTDAAELPLLRPTMTL